MNYSSLFLATSKIEDVPKKLMISDWTTFYGSGLDEPTANDLEYTGDDFLNLSLQNHAWVFNCYFHSMSARDGGAILYGIDGGKCLIESTSFFECRAFQQGGAIFVNYGDCVIHEVCGYLCKSDLYFSFCDVWQEVGYKEKNFVKESSIARCNSPSLYTMYHNNGYIECASLNISHNTAGTYSALSLWPTSGDGTKICFSSIANNNATKNYCLHMTNLASQTESTNIIRNRQENPSGCGLICTNKNSKMPKCCIFENQEAPIFQSESETLTLYECTIGEGQLISKLGSIETTFVPSSFINELTFITTGYCVNIFDTLDTKSPGIQTSVALRKIRRYGNIIDSDDVFNTKRHQMVLKISITLFLICFYRSFRKE